MRGIVNTPIPGVKRRDGPGIFVDEFKQFFLSANDCTTPLLD